MKYIIIFALLLSGCTTISVGKPWPLQEDAYLLQPCQQLLTIEKPRESSMSTVVDIVEANYGLWHDCKTKTDAWIKWYNTHWKETK